MTDLLGLFQYLKYRKFLHSNWTVFHRVLCRLITILGFSWRSCLFEFGPPWKMAYHCKPQRLWARVISTAVLLLTLNHHPSLQKKTPLLGVIWYHFATALSAQLSHSHWHLLKSATYCPKFQSRFQSCTHCLERFWKCSTWMLIKMSGFLLTKKCRW